MKKLEEQLIEAKKRQILVFSGLTVIGLLGLFLILLILVIPRGIRIHVLEPVSNEQIHIDGGAAFLFSNTLYTIFSEPRIRVSADGFKTKIVTIQKEDFGKTKEIELEPLPSVLNLTTGFNDGLTRWTVNDELISMGDGISVEVDAGSHDVKISNPYYLEKSVNLSVSLGETLVKEIELEPLPGKLMVKTVPTGANVYLDDKLIGSSPLEYDLEGGKYAIKILKDKYESISENIGITQSRLQINKNYKLQLKKGTLNLDLKPEGGELFLNKILLSSGKQIKMDATIDNEILYSKEGFFPEKRIVNLSADETRNLSIRLKQEFGRVTIRSNPDGSVFVNGNSAGSTPLTLELPAVEQNISIQKPGFRAQAVSVRPDSKREKLVDVRLMTEKEARLKEAKLTYKNVAGGELRLFLVNDTFTMGAERSERGQRANEFVKQIKLTRPFYAGVNEVTYSEYQKYNKQVSGAPGEPVTSITWMDAIKYCNWLSDSEKLTPVYEIKNGRLKSINDDADGYRLLTEAEWEWLARKSRKKKQTLFVWGNELVIPKKAVNVADESAKGKVKYYVPRYNDGYVEVAPARSFSVEKSGLYDQGGNVSEWVHDRYSIDPPTSGKIYTDPFSTDVGGSRVVKGANWRSGSITELRASFREGHNDKRDDIGFRLGRYLHMENTHD